MDWIFNKIVNFLNFRNLSIKQKILVFSLGSLFWLMLISAIGLITIFKMSSMSKQMVEEIVPQEKVINSVIRKLRGANISVHKMILYREHDVIDSYHLRAKERLNDCKDNLTKLLEGGVLEDYSRGSELLLEKFYVHPVHNIETRKFIEEIISKIDNLEKELEVLKVSIKSGVSTNLLLEKVSYFDISINESIRSLTQHLSIILNEWRLFVEAMHRKFSIAIILISSFFLLTALLSGTFGLLISKSLIKSVTEITEQFKKLHSGDIDLTQKLNVYSKDELGELTKEFNNFMEAIRDLSSFKKVIEEDETVEDIYLRLAKIFKEVLGFDKFTIYEVANSKNNMKIVYPLEAENSQLYCNREVLLDCQLCRVNRTAHVVSSEEYSDICKYYLEGNEYIHFCVPIIVGGNVGGIVQFICDKREECNIEETRRKIKRAMQYIEEAQPVIEAKRLMRALKDSTFRDALTGLYNRRFLEESFENLIAGILRRGTVLGLLMCDVDFFKQINDMYGHDIGDMVLKEVGNCIKKSVRASDLVVRFGGEEFLVLLLDTKQGCSMEVAEKIRKKVEDTKIRITGGFIQKTISIGVSEFPTDTQNFWEAIKFADVALYKAKEMGRNRVVRFLREMWTEENY